MNKINNKTTFVFSPKHRTGKTTISNYLGLLFAKKGYLTAVIELDRYCSYSPFLNNTLTNNSKTLKNIINGESIEKNFVQSKHNENLFNLSLCFNDELLDLYRFPKEHIYDIFKFANDKFDKVFIDMPTGYLENGLMYTLGLEHNQTIQVLDDDMSCLHSLKLYDLTFNQMGLKMNNIISIINKSHGLINEKLFDSLNSKLSALNSKEVFFIPYMPDIIKAGNEGKMLCDITPSDRAERQLVSTLNDMVLYIENLGNEEFINTNKSKSSMFAGIKNKFRKTNEK